MVLEERIGETKKKKKNYVEATCPPQATLIKARKRVEGEENMRQGNIVSYDMAEFGVTGKAQVATQHSS